MPVPALTGILVGFYPRTALVPFHFVYFLPFQAPLPLPQLEFSHVFPRLNFEFRVEQNIDWRQIVTTLKSSFARFQKL